MKKTKFLLFIVLSLFIFSCSKKEQINQSTIKEKNLQSQVLETFIEGKEALDGGDVLFAAKKFTEVQVMFPQSIWAPHSNLMAAYAYYSQDYYFDATQELEIFLRKYPKHSNVDYAYYLMAICYYEQIVDEKKDLNSVVKSKEYFEIVIDQFPNTDYALDSKFKLEFVMDILASKEMYLGRYYLKKKKWIAAINRFKTVLEEYDTTIYIEEALHRLVEVHYLIGLKEEAKKYASVLGYNYESSQWYENTYALFDKRYEINQKKFLKENKKKSKFTSKIKSLLKLDE
ncbi:outer membrane protein assembly factor BamD [Candidatus Pelagibacter sp.]|jgi:outer membrane protein assembly factor BamD|nr:outer membrane protein assembly factor BamD [Candidatus Pelagibacter bacterium]MDC1132956.1 outer membrane protein assembly factor BamD [Candidatus Pelagibacter sp.]